MARLLPQMNLCVYPFFVVPAARVRGAMRDASDAQRPTLLMRRTYRARPERIKKKPTNFSKITLRDSRSK
jgi:hypothetical protein